ncbi:MAG TPA: ribonuclease P protein component [Acidobacteriaceae bacterium]|jgi:ribonuclease P protein component|nr:ribonuclease P protein component [Acidobacteriaceae bacterium]
MPSDLKPSPGSPIFRLRKHADYQAVYAGSRKQFSKQMAYFALLRPEAAPGTPNSHDQNKNVPRVGLTAGKVLGGAVERNRIKRRMREAVRMHLDELHLPLDLILHPRRNVLTLEFAQLEKEVRQIFRSVQSAAAKGALPAPQAGNANGKRGRG